MHLSPIRTLTITLWICLTAVPAIAADDDVTPVRLSFTEGQVSFWRPGAEDWAPARMNLPIAPSDILYSGDDSKLGLQLGPAAYARADARTELGLVNHEEGFLQLELTAGRLALDLREMRPNDRIEIDTRNAVFTIEDPGYYGVSVTGDQTIFAPRNGGRAVVITGDDDEEDIDPYTTVIVTGDEHPDLRIDAATPMDAWDRWNLARTDSLIAAPSRRYVSQDIYGADSLDDYGDWREEPQYGHVWYPTQVASHWVPYSTGSWIWDPYFGWTWLDDAPWGWAPFHYGRWIHIGGRWGWAPGPTIYRSIYAPALVAFFGNDISIYAGFSQPLLGWTALGWGEPICPWWGPRNYVGVPSWRGWGGPRIVNNTVINNTTIVHNISQINYQNTRVPDAVVAVPQANFGRGRLTGKRVVSIDGSRINTLRGGIPVKPVAASVVPERGPAVRPPKAAWRKRILATRPARAATHKLHPDTPRFEQTLDVPEQRLVKAPNPERRRTRLEHATTGLSARPRHPAIDGRDGSPDPPAVDLHRLGSQRHQRIERKALLESQPSDLGAAQAIPETGIEPNRPDRDDKRRAQIGQINLERNHRRERRPAEILDSSPLDSPGPNLIDRAPTAAETPAPKAEQPTLRFRGSQHLTRAPQARDDQRRFDQSPPGWNNPRQRETIRVLDVDPSVQIQPEHPSIGEPSGESGMMRQRRIERSAAPALPLDQPAYRSDQPPRRSMEVRTPVKLAPQQSQPLRPESRRPVQLQNPSFDDSNTRHRAREPQRQESRRNQDPSDDHGSSRNRQNQPRSRTKAQGHGSDQPPPQASQPFTNISRKH